MYCRRCGNNVPETAKFCLHCGEEMKKNTNMVSSDCYQSQNIIRANNEMMYQKQTLHTYHPGHESYEKSDKGTGHSQLNQGERRINTNNLLQFFASPLGRCVITILCMLIVFGLIMLMLQSFGPGAAFIAILLCGYFGWRALNRITPSMFLIGNMDFWVAYFVVKGIFAAMIGMFVAPFQIARMISGWINNKIGEM